LNYWNRTLESLDIKSVLRIGRQVGARLVNAVDEACQNNRLFLRKTREVDVSPTDIDDLHIIGESVLSLVQTSLSKRVLAGVETDTEKV
jgi:hypothetical protein